MKRVLLVNNDPAFITEMQTLLAGQCDLLAVSDVPSAIQLLWRTTVDLILLGAKLPRFFSKQEETEGLALLKWLKGSIHAGIPVVMLFDYSSEEVESEASSLGAKVTVVKVSGVGEVLEMVVDKG